MQRGITILLGAAVICLAVFLAIQSVPARSSVVADASAEASSDASAEAEADAASTVGTAVDSGVVLLTELADDLPSDAGTALPPGAPKQVRFGVVLVSFEGSQAPAGGNGAPSTRTKKDATALADELAQAAKGDFHAAVQRGDSGSADDVGHVKRGVLEPATELALFTLPVGGVSAPIETPRGFWIVKRLE